jgi:mRNA-degrading endonuclease toxin of MazEF toxin-antitoxin module
VTPGEVWWVEFPARGGHAQAGRRPAIVVQRVKGLPTVLLIPLTSQLDALRFQGTELVEPDAQNGLRKPSVALVFQLAAVDRRYLASQIGGISDAVLKKIWSSFDELTGR